MSSKRRAGRLWEGSTWRVKAEPSSRSEKKARLENQDSSAASFLPPADLLKDQSVVLSLCLCSCIIHNCSLFLLWASVLFSWITALQERRGLLCFSLCAQRGLLGRQSPIMSQWMWTLAFAGRWGVLVYPRESRVPEPVFLSSPNREMRAQNE